MPSRAAECASITAPRSRQKIHQARIAIVEHAESAGPPLGSLEDVGARAQQQIDGRPIAPLYRCEQRVYAEALVGQRIVDGRAQFRITLEDFADAGRIGVADCGLQRFCRGVRQRFNVPLQIRPGGEAVFLGQRVLRVREMAMLLQCAAVLWLVF